MFVFKLPRWFIREIDKVWRDFLLRGPILGPSFLPYSMEVDLQVL